MRLTVSAVCLDMSGKVLRETGQESLDFMRLAFEGIPEKFRRKLEYQDCSMDEIFNTLLKSSKMKQSG